jgi:AraC-like DNA-binding protein
MRMTVIAPSARTSAFVERFTIVESDDEATRTLLPEGGLHFGVRYRGAASLVRDAGASRLGDQVVTGLRPVARVIRTHANSGIVVALFRTTGAAQVFRMPLHELWGNTVDVEQLVGRSDAVQLADRIREPVDDVGRVAVVEEFLAARWSPMNRDRLVDAAVARLREVHGRLRIADLADELGISQDPLEKRFRRIVGGSPKQLAQILRISRAVGLARAGASLATVAHRVGYFDQSHFIREFRAVAGQSPSKFLRDADDDCC